MGTDTNRLKQVMQPVDLILTYDLVKLQHRDEVDRTAFWNQIENSENIFEREYLNELSADEKTEKVSQFTLARLWLAVAAKANGEKSPITKYFNQKELDLVSNFEAYNKFEVLSVEDIAETIYRQRDLRNLAMGLYSSEYARLDSLLDSPEVRKDLKIAFNQKYRDRLNKVVKGAQAYIGKYGMTDPFNQVKEAVLRDINTAKPAGTTGNETQEARLETKKENPAESKEKKWWELEKVRLVLSIAVLVITLCGLLGWKFWPSSQPGGPYTLITQSIPGDMGSVQVSPLPEADGKYTAGTRIKLEARASSRASFVRWSGDASGTMPSIVITIDKDKQVVAEFESVSGK